jgi:predicted branched-subunit amino acid permease
VGRSSPGEGAGKGHAAAIAARTEEVRRRLVVDGVGIAVSAGAFAVVYGVAARQTGLSLVETASMSLLVLAGASQFAALGMIAEGVPWAAIVLLTALLNARHLLYAAVLAPWFAGTSRRARAAAGYVLADETFALALPAFRSLGRADLRTYAIAAAVPVIPWVSMTLVGYLGGQLLPSPGSLGLDVVFPAAMAGLAVALVSDRPGVVTATAGALIGLATALTVGTSVGVMAGALAGPLLALALARRTPAGAAETA